MTEKLGFAVNDAAWAGLSDDDVVRLLDDAEARCRFWWSQAVALQAETRRRRLFHTDGSRTTAQWSAARYATSSGTAADQVRVGAACERLPELAEAVANGALSPDQAVVIARRATPATVREMLSAAHDQDTIRGLRRVVAGIAAAHPEPHVDVEVAPGDDPDLAVQPPGSVLRPSEVRATCTIDGRIMLFGDFTADDGEAVLAGLRAATEVEVAADPDGRTVPYRRRMALALQRIVCGGDTPPQAHLVVHVHDQGDALDPFATTGSGEPITVPAMRRYLCDADVRPVLYGTKDDIGIGRRSRRVPNGVAEHVRERDGHECRFPGCANTLWTNLHHIEAWEHGGPTVARNLVVLCSFHHRLVHDDGWQTRGDAETLTFHRPNGTRFEPGESPDRR